MMQSEAEVKAQKKLLQEEASRKSDQKNLTRTDQNPTPNPFTTTSSDGPRLRHSVPQPVDVPSPPVTTQRDHTLPQLTPSSAANISTVPPTVKQAQIQTTPADIPRQSRNSRFASLVLIWILLAVIGMLVLRRIIIGL